MCVLCVRVRACVCVNVHTRVYYYVSLFMCVYVTAHVEALRNRGPVGRKNVLFEYAPITRVK